MSPDVLSPLQVLLILDEMTDAEAAEVMRQCEPIDDAEFCIRASAALRKWRAKKAGGAIG